MQNQRKIVAPICAKCAEPMVWKSEQIVGGKHMQVFQCETCEKMEAVLLQSGSGAAIA
jgi:hypothetical protein